MDNIQWHEREQKMLHMLELDIGNQTSELKLKARCNHLKSTKETVEGALLNNPPNNSLI